MNYYLTLIPRDPVIARDGRPFGLGQGNRMRSVPWPHPSLLAGSLRTLLGKLAGTNFNAETLAILKRVTVAGPFPRKSDQTGGQVYFPAPRDVIFREERDEKKGFPLRPTRLAKDEGVDLPHANLLPVMPPGDEEEFKPGDGPAFWSCGQMLQWLTDSRGDCFSLPQGKGGEDFLEAPKQDERMHIHIDPGRGAAAEEILFSTVGLDLEGLQLEVRINGADSFAAQLDTLDCLHPFGGERRLVRWTVGGNADLWRCPDKLLGDLKQSVMRGVRLVLATPATFQYGWLPGWLDNRLEGSPRGCGVRLRLVGACLERWQAISGWSLRKGRQGPKPIRRIVPAGSVYFFEVLAGSPQVLAQQLWLQSVCDDRQDRRDGFGLALWGLWDTRE